MLSLDGLSDTLQFYIGISLPLYGTIRIFHILDLVGQNGITLWPEPYKFSNDFGRNSLFGIFPQQ